MLTLIALAIFAVIGISLFVVWIWPAQTPRRYTGKLKKLG